jgi:anion-transporting  ArsA/GET3 family ATPase
MKISKIHLIHFRNDAHFQYCVEFRELVAKFNPQTLKLKPLFDGFPALLDREDEALKKISKSALTEKIQEADVARDETFSGMAELNDAMRKHFNPDKRDAAKRVAVVLHTYGNVAKKAMNEETSAVFNMLQDLRSDKYASDAAAIGLTEWADELEERNNLVEKLMRERFDEGASKSHIVLKEAREAVDALHNKIIKRLEALIEIDGEANYEDFVNTFNEIAAKYNVKHHRMHNRNENEDAMQPEIPSNDEN